VKPACMQGLSSFLRPSLDFHGNRVANTAAALRRAIGSEAPPPAHRFQPFLWEMARLARRRVAGFALPCITDCQDSCYA